MVLGSMVEAAECTIIPSASADPENQQEIAEYSVSLPVEDYEDIFKSKGISFSDITMSVSVMTSDTGHSGANIYPSVIGTMPGGRKYRVPILGSICMDHKEKANIKEFESNLSLAFSQTEKSKERIRELDAISLNYPFNCFCNILKKVGIGKKQAEPLCCHHRKRCSGNGGGCLFQSLRDHL